MLTKILPTQTTNIKHDMHMFGKPLEALTIVYLKQNEPFLPYIFDCILYSNLRCIVVKHTLHVSHMFISPLIKSNKRFQDNLMLFIHIKLYHHLLIYKSLPRSKFNRRRDDRVQKIFP